MESTASPPGLIAEKLANNPSIHAINSIVLDLIRLIDGKILAANESGYCSTEYELPTNFCISNMAKNDAQTMVYSELIRLFIAKGFVDTRIDTRDTPRLVVRWKSGMSEEEKQRRRRYIHEHTIRSPTGK